MIPLFALQQQYKDIRPEIEQAVNGVHTRGNYILGVEVQAFENEFARYIGVHHGVGVASGTDALTLAVRALGLSSHDEVLMPVNAYPTFFGIAMSGVIVRFVDCGIDGNIDPADLIKRITKKTKAIVVVHLYGNPADIVGIKQMIKKLHRTDIAIIEDCAQAHGATIGKQKVGTFGDISIFSFYPSKNLGAYGDGGMVLTKHKNIADHVRRLRMYGEKKRYESIEVSGVSRLDELQAAMLRIKLRHLDAWNTRRREIADLYRISLRDIQQITVLPYLPGSCHHLFVICTKKRDALKAYLEKNGIGGGVHYPIPLQKKGFPMATTLSKEILSLPIYPELTDAQISRVCVFISSFFSLNQENMCS